MRPLRVAIVGGGITGLSAAYYLRRLAARRGVSCSIAVLEAGTAWGGKIRTERVDGFILEAGPEGFLSTKAGMRQLCEELGLGEQLTSPAVSRTYVLASGRLRPLPPGLGFRGDDALRHLWRSDLLTWRGKLRAAVEPWIPPAPPGREESVAEFARRRFGREAAARIIEPLFAGIHGGDAEAISLAAAFPQFAAIERQYGSLRAGMRAVSRPGRGDGGQGAAQMETVRTGMATVVERLTECLQQREPATGQDPVILLLGRRVVSLRDARRGGAGEVGGSPRYQLVLESGEVQSFDRVLLTTPAPVTGSILEEACPEATRWLAAIPYVPAASVYLGYRAGEAGRTLDGTGYVVAREGRPRPVTACTWVSAKWPHCAPPGWVLLRCHMAKAVLGGAGWPASSASGVGDAELADQARAEVAEVLGIRAEPAFVRVLRWDLAFPQYTLGHRERVAAIEGALRSLPGVRVAGAPYRGVGLPDCVRQGQEAAEALLAVEDP